ncbi:MAG: phosphoenolpyruvate carboxykinase (ATP), partial [Peptococcaceae bacterium]|nr:phosphoenolpyruvate carboxykinase (ATP) [Peptococcaceae bacterium]
MDTKIRKELDKIGLKNLGEIKHNLTPALLVEEAFNNGEGVFTDTGAFRVETGKFTGRSPKDRFIVKRRSIEKEIAWGSVNMPIEPDVFERLYDKVMAYLEGKNVYVFDGLAGADVQYQMQTRIVNEYAHQNLFMHQLLVRPTKEKIGCYVPDINMICAPGFKCDPAEDGVNSDAAIILDLEKRIILIVGSSYCGEMKKSVFSAMNYFLPKQNVLSMHCSANMDPDSGDVALFFGLSGTGKTTLSADPARMLIGDDEHGWSNSGVFNIEGGCYAK